MGHATALVQTRQREAERLRKRAMQNGAQARVECGRRNHQRILEALATAAKLGNPRMTRPQIVIATYLSKTSVSRGLERLLADGRIARIAPPREGFAPFYELVSEARASAFAKETTEARAKEKKS